MKLKTAKKLKFGDRVFVKHSFEGGNLSGKYGEVINHPIGIGKPVYGSVNWVDVSITGSYEADDDWGSVEINHLKRVNVLPKDCVAGTKVRIRSDADSSYDHELGKITTIVELANDGFYSEPSARVKNISDFPTPTQHVKLSDLELYYE